MISTRGAEIQINDGDFHYRLIVSNCFFCLINSLNPNTFCFTLRKDEEKEETVSIKKLNLGAFLLKNDSNDYSFELSVESISRL